jgi:2-polyprenyl-3-methyl-5-hydroxy-6-metoxy-1,4-benzoquinol methylase
MNYPYQWNSGKPETICGHGARLSETNAIREELPKIVSRHKIKTIADVGCGDQNWMRKIEWLTEVKVYGFDAHPHNEHVLAFDCVKCVLPASFDMIQCIYVLNHLYEPGAIERAISNFKSSGIPWLLATYNEAEPLPLLGKPYSRLFHKTKTSANITRSWYYGLWKLNDVPDSLRK